MMALRANILLKILIVPSNVISTYNFCRAAWVEWVEWEAWVEWAACLAWEVWEVCLAWEVACLEVWTWQR